MKRLYFMTFCLTAGVIAITGSGLSAQWSAARRPRGSTRVAPAVSVSRTVAKSEVAAPARSFRCRPVSSIHRPRGRRIAAVPVPPAIPRVPAPPPEIIVEIEEVSLEPEVAAPAPSSPAPPEPPEKKPAQKPASSYGKVPPYFIRNDGQLDQAVRYYVKGPRGTVYLTNTEVVFDFLKENPPEEGEEEEEEEPGRHGPERDEKKTFTRLVFRRQFKDSNPEVKVDGKKELPGKINYFIGGKDNWHSNIPTVEEIVYHDLYPGIDLNCFFEGANIKYHYTVKPGSDPGLLIFQYVGIDGLEIKPSGDLIVLTPFGGFVTPAPSITQEIGGKEKEIEGEFTIQDDTTVTYKIGPYDRQYQLTIK